MVVQKYFTIIIPTTGGNYNGIMILFIIPLYYIIMNSGGCEYRTKPNQI